MFSNLAPLFLSNLECRLVSCSTFTTGLGSGLGRVRVRFRGSFSCQLIIDSQVPVHDPPGSGSGYRFTIHDLRKNPSDFW